MRRKLISIRPRLVTSLTVALGISALFGQAYGAAKGAYVVGNRGYYIYDTSAYQSRSYANARGAHYGPHYFGRYIDRYCAAALSQTADYYLDDGNKYDPGYSVNYTGRYNVYRQESSYTPRSFVVYQRPYSMTDKGTLANAGYYGSAIYEDGAYVASLLASYDEDKVLTDTVPDIAQHYINSQTSANGCEL